MIDVCQLLKETRLQRGLSLEEVAQRTYIKQYYLEALEEGAIEKLPAPVHTFGYIRLYAKLLGLDGGALVAQFQQQSGLNAGGGKAPSRGSEPLPPEAAYKPTNGSGQSQPSNGNGRGAGLFGLGRAPEPEAVREPVELAAARVQAEQVMAAAQRDAQQLVQGAEVYADDVLGTLEAEIDRALQIVRNGREFLQLRRQPESPGA